MQISLCTEQVRTAEGSETSRTGQQAEALGSHMLQGGKEKGSPKPDPAEPAVRHLRAGRHWVVITSRSWDFWYSHSAFWEVKKALPSWTLHSQGFSENLVWVPAQLSLSKLTELCLCCSTEGGEDQPSIPSPSWPHLLCCGPCGVAHVARARWSQPSGAGSNGAGWTIEALSSCLPRSVGRTCD